MHYFFFLWITFSHLLSPVHSCNSGTDCKTLFSNQNFTAHVMGKFRRWDGAKINK
jgi:hypothetical protein